MADLRVSGQSHLDEDEVIRRSVKGKAATKRKSILNPISTDVDVTIVAGRSASATHVKPEQRIRSAVNLKKRKYGLIGVPVVVFALSSLGGFGEEATRLLRAFADEGAVCSGQDSAILFTQIRADVACALARRQYDMLHELVDRLRDDESRFRDTG